MCLHLEKVGQRVYVRGNSYAIKDDIKAAGAKWDAAERAWWVGVKKAEAVQAVLDAQTSKPTKSDGDKTAERDQDCKGEDTTVIGRATYKGRSYYVVWQGRTKSGEEKAKLVDRKGEKSFWVNRGEIQWDKSYGRPDRRSGRVDYPTIGGLAAYAERMKREDAADAAGTSETKICWECGGRFTQRDARSNQGDWSDSYCGC